MKLSRNELEQMIRDRVRVVYDHSLPEGTFKYTLGGVTETAEAIIEEERKRQPRSTGWRVAVKRVGEAWEPIMCINPYDERWEEEELPEWDELLTIDEPEDLPEWDGF